MSSDFVPDMVSIVIPCRNEAKAIRETVSALLKSNYPNIEVLVVDGISEDGTRDIMNQLCKEDSRVRMVDNVQQLTPFAFNLGVKNARGEFVQIVGARNVLDPDYIPILVKTLKARPDVACVGGDYQHIYDSPSGRLVSLAMESKFGMGFGNYRTMQSDTFVDTVGIPLYHRSVFELVGYFDEMLTRNQDDDFNFRVRQAGLKILYVHQAKATYLVRGSLKKAFRQFSQYGYFKVFVNRKHRAVTTARQMVPALFLATLIVLTVAVVLPLSAEFRKMALTVLGAILLLYFALGLLLAGKSLSIMDRFRVVKACVVLHVGYGLGYWMGVWDFLLRNQKPRLLFQGQTT